MFLLHRPIILPVIFLKVLIDTKLIGNVLLQSNTVSHILNDVVATFNTVTGINNLEKYFCHVLFFHL